MADDSFLKDATALASFNADKITKRDCFRTARLFLGLNSLTRGQSQRTHAHDGADKFYLVLSGKARITIGSDAMILGPAGIAWAPAGVPHGVDEALEDSVLLIGMAPPP